MIAVRTISTPARNTSHTGAKPYTITSTTAGDLLIAHVAWNNTEGAVVTGITGGGTWAQATTQNLDASSHHAIWYAHNVSGGVTSLTITTNDDGSPLAPLQVTVIHCSGAATASALDRAPTATTGTSTGPSITSGALAQADEIIVSANSHTGNDLTTMVEDTADGYSEANQNLDNDDGQCFELQYKVVSATTSNVVNATYNASRSWGAILASFKGATSGGISGTLAQTLDELTTATSAGTVAITGTTTVTLDVLTGTGEGVLPIVGDLTATLDLLTVVVTGTVDVVADAAVTLEMVTLVAAGAVDVQGAVTVTLEVLTLTAGAAVGDVPVTGELAALLDNLLTGASGTVAVQGTAAGTLDTLTLTATGTCAVQASAAIILEAVVGTATGTVPMVAIEGVLGVILDALTVVHESTWLPVARPGAPTTTVQRWAPTTTQPIGHPTTTDLRAVS